MQLSELVSNHLVAYLATSDLEFQLFVTFWAQFTPQSFLDPFLHCIPSVWPCKHFSVPF